ncbi:ubiquinol-cytochrome c reductase iron-sulfur subunit [Ferrovibrio terrae]|uniref:ubiquinol-cytochrome c reductase iron-sulfur subunit n=1 Tax=Ferrovibrio terrae TaxID=2594003 RepID=UPI0031380346
MAGTATQAAGTTEPTRRDFIVVSAGAFAAVGAAAAVWPFIHQMNPSADVLALSSTEVDLSQIAAGQSVTILWRGKPVFVRHRTAAEIEQAKKDDAAALPDPAKDADRVKKPEWLVMMGVCTHLGCVPLGQQGEFGGWFCPCHGSHYDTSGRIRKGPAPANLPIPEYAFLNDTRIRIG